MVKEINQIRTQLGQIGPSTLQRVTSIFSSTYANNNGNGDGRSQKLAFEQQRILLDKWEMVRKSSGRKEVTGDRILLAERLRRELEFEIERRNQQNTSTTASSSSSLSSMTYTSKTMSEVMEIMHEAKMNPSEAHVHFVNSIYYEKQQIQENQKKTNNIKQNPVLNTAKCSNEVSITNRDLSMNINMQENPISPSSTISSISSAKAAASSPSPSSSLSLESQASSSVLTTLIETGELENVAVIDPKDASTSSVRFVVISDTHGWEESLTKDNDLLEPWEFTKYGSNHDDVNHELMQQNECLDREPKEDCKKNILPDGDVLLHLGDFAVDGSKTTQEKALERFDKWLSYQPHSTKIVIRGNHDPMKVPFPLSNAIYVTKPTTMDVRRHNSDEDVDDDRYQIENKQSNGNRVKLSIVPYGGFSRSRSKSRAQSKRMKKSFSSSSSSTPNQNRFPSWCDVLASHEPPRGILDKCISGRRAGNPNLRTAVETMEGDPPKVWFCGHIHEGRGYERVTFGTRGKMKPTQPYPPIDHTKKKRLIPKQRRETLVMNAANANPGRALHLIHGPLIVDVPSRYEEDIVIDRNQKSNRYSKKSAKSWIPKHSLPKLIEEKADYSTNMMINTDDSKIEEMEPIEECTQLLLAIDLGLKCGSSIYNDQGKLVWYEQLSFQDSNDVWQRVPTLLHKWERMLNHSHGYVHDWNSDSDSDSGKIKKIFYLAIEGGYGELWDAWSTCVSRHSSTFSKTPISKTVQIEPVDITAPAFTTATPIQVLNIRPEEWRTHLLLPKEQSNSRTSKEAARLMARQIVHKFGIMKQHEGKFKTDVAESITMGFFVAYQYLGWISHDQSQSKVQQIPLIERYMNGQIVVPKKQEK